MFQSTPGHVSDRPGFPEKRRRPLDLFGWHTSQVLDRGQIKVSTHLAPYLEHGPARDGAGLSLNIHSAQQHCTGIRITGSCRHRPVRPSDICVGGCGQTSVTGPQQTVCTSPIRNGALVQARRKSASYHSCSIITCDRSRASAPSEPGRTCSHSSTRWASPALRGSTTTSFAPVSWR